ncbi:immunoglobulin kappa light chain-like [Hemitrygon akajei]|uniref:immunoglobulin kappa light chain-like n=1 Tax=Hemitrygon akajei TaxID=2704970 RepID=UPI003BF9576F
MSPLGKQLLLILLHSLLSEGKYQNVMVSQTPFMIKALKGQTVKINCSYSHENYDQLLIEWRRNNSAQKLCNYVFNRNMTNYTQCHCIQRININLDSSINLFVLSIYNLQLSDSDIYFCRVSFQIPPPVQGVEGKGTNLTVEAFPRVYLKAEPLPAPNAGVQLNCTSVEFYPGSIQVSWFRDGQLITNGTEDGPLYSNSDGSFSMASFLNLSVPDWSDGGNYSCQVNHSRLSKPIIQYISVQLTDNENITCAIEARIAVLAMATLIVITGLILYFKTGNLTMNLNHLSSAMCSNVNCNIH